jgi:hypothetical protein
MLGLAFKLAMITVTLMGLMGGSSSANSPRPADGQLWAEIRVAEKYWAKRGLTSSCPGIHARIAPYPWQHDGPVDGWTSGFGTCDLAITPRVARITRRALWKWSRVELAQECRSVVHEYGHGALALGHDDETLFPVMAEGSYDETIPTECKSWARANRTRAIRAHRR